MTTVSWRCLRILLLLISFQYVVPGTGNAQSPAYDSIFLLKGYRRTIGVNDALFQAKQNQPADTQIIAQLVQEKGTASDKIALELFRGSVLPDGESEAGKTKQVQVFETYLPEVRKLGDHFLEAFIYYTISTRYLELGQHNKSIENRLYCLDALEKDPENRHYEQSWFLYTIAEEFYRFRDYEKAVHLAKDAFALKGLNAPNPPWFLRTSSNLIGMSYLKAGKYDSARYWLQQTLDLANEHKDDIWIGIATGNIGHIFFLQKKWSEAIPFYEKSLINCRKYSLWDNVAPFSCNLAECLIQIGKKEMVPSLLQEARKALEQFERPALVSIIKYFTVAESYYRYIGNTAAAAQATDSLNYYRNREQEAFNITQKNLTEAELAYRNKELENQLLRQNEKRQRLITYSLVAIMLLLIVAVILFTKRQRLREQLRREKLEREKIIAEEELHLALTEIKDFTWHIVEKNKLIETYAAELDNLKKANSSITDEQLASLEELRNTILLTDKDWNNFKVIFEKAHPGFLQRLRTRYPDLTPAETRYMVFTKINVTPKEMSAMVGIGAEAIRHIRFRLKKKLKLEDGNEINELVESI